MPSIAPLMAQQIADLFGAIDEFVGTGDNVATAYQLDFFPVTNTQLIVDQLTGVGDGATTLYQLHAFPVAPGTLKLRRISIQELNPDVNLLLDPTHYSVNLMTGLVTLTPTGVTFLGTEQLHAKYTVPSTLELHTGTIAGPLLIEGGHFTLDSDTGAITLTSTGVIFLGVLQLHAKYQWQRGVVNTLTEANTSLRASIVQNGIDVVALNARDQDIKYVHEQIESKAILHVEAERRALQNPSDIFVTPWIETGNFVSGAEQVTETKIVDSVDDPYVNIPSTHPLYPDPAAVGLPGTGNARWLDAGRPRNSEGLTGGSSFDPANEENQISIEVAQYASIIDAHGDFAGPFGWDARFAEAATTVMLAAIAAQQTALTAQIAAITAFLTDNPVPNDHVTAGDIADATAASAAASARFAANAAYVPTVTAPPHSGLQDAEILSPTGTRYLASTARATFITGTRRPQLDVLLTFLWSRRFFWVDMRASIGTGTLFNFLSTGKAIVSAQAQIASNTTRINEILALLAAQ